MKFTESKQTESNKFLIYNQSVFYTAILREIFTECSEALKSLNHSIFKLSWLIFTLEKS